MCIVYSYLDILTVFISLLIDLKQKKQPIQIVLHKLK